MKIQNQLGYIKGITFAPFHKRGSLSTQTARDSFDYMIEHTAADFVILAPVGLQDHAHSEEICYTSSATFSDEELINMIRYAKSKSIRVALKPTVNCKNGVWRAYISFFEKDVPCEPKWGNWFASYTEFQTHYAKIAEAEQCDLFIAGCEMVMTEHRSEEWRNVIAAIRNYYHGPVSYNTDKYQEENVTWWDCVDMISSSGYYPIDQWEQELDRIERVVQKFKKPFFFAEAGCMSRKGSSMVPNNWQIRELYVWRNNQTGIELCSRPAQNAHGSMVLPCGNGHRFFLPEVLRQEMPATKSATNRYRRLLKTTMGETKENNIQQTSE